MYTSDTPQAPALVYRRSTIYPRSSEASGVDFVIERLGDLATTPQGDLALTTGSDLITQALLRRLYTPTYGYKRWVRTATGMVELDSDYADPIFDYLSTPLTETARLEIERVVRRAASADDRIEVVNTIIEPIDGSAALNTVRLTVLYRIKSEPELLKIQTELLLDLQVS